MEGRIEMIFYMVLVIATIHMRSGLAEVQTAPQFPLIPGSPIDITKCWSSLTSIQGCVIEIYKSAVTGKFENVGPACCKAFTDVDAKCWPKMFPLNPLFPPLHKDGCSRIGSAAPSRTTPQFPIIPGSPVDLTKCLSSLVSVEGCVTEIHKSLFTGKFDNVGAMCCKAFSAIDAKCWPQMFPLNPFFPPLLKNECSRLAAVASTHK
ncbi:Egg cell-secreted-like protein [Hirschfeldia incana]|nr:Egg cell-secreted-like protein [Hirschfeldia incana]